MENQNLDEKKDDLIDENKGGEIDEEKEQLKQAVTSLTKEIQETRKSRQEDRDALQALLKGDDNEGEDNPPATDDTEEKVNQILAKKEQEKIEQYKVSAMEEFKIKHPEFHPDNDPGGIKFMAFEKELNKFNLNGLSDKKDFLDRFNDVHRFMNRDKSPQPSNINTGADTPAGGGSSPKEVDRNNLTHKENELIQSQGWDKERYLKLKAKHPRYVEKLLSATY